ncbi:MAG: hypothetical protein N2510_09330, partial [Ignavibacteria bacterium]|nr:hypothetical protein [Ignavibacteria bacterium]
MKIPLIIITAFIFISCGEDSTQNPPPPPSGVNIDIRPGSVYTFTYDTIDQNNNSHRINRFSRDSVMTTITIGNSVTSAIRSVTTGDIPSIDT